MVFMPHSKVDKLALPYHGPYCIVDVFGNTLSLRPVDHPGEKLILVNMNHVTLCPSELRDSSWLGPTAGAQKRKRAETRYNLCN